MLAGRMLPAGNFAFKMQQSTFTFNQMKDFSCQLSLVIVIRQITSLACSRSAVLNCLQLATHNYKLPQQFKRLPVHCLFKNVVFPLCFLKIFLRHLKNTIEAIMLFYFIGSKDVEFWQQRNQLSGYQFNLSVFNVYKKCQQTGFQCWG